MILVLVLVIVGAIATSLEPPLATAARKRKEKKYEGE